MDETAAREVVLVRVLDRAEPESPRWTAADRAWASRVAAETVGSGATPEAFVASRAHAALQRLLPRDRPASTAVWRWLQRPLWRPTLVLLAAVLAFVAGAAVDRVGGPYINLLAPPAWAIVVWNAGVYVLLLAGALVGLVRRRPATPGPIAGLVRKAVRRSSDMGAPRGLDDVGLAGAWPDFAAEWMRATAPLTAARASAVLHAAAAALAAGLLAGLYVRGLALDYRAGWQSTFLDASTVHAVLGTLFAPASRGSGVPLPDLAGVEALRLVAANGGIEGGGSAAPWIHLYAWTLGAAVVLPRALLALWSLGRARRLSRRFPLPLHEPYFQQMLRHLRSGAARVRLCPHAQAPSAQATLALRDICARVWGEGVQVDVDPTVGYGDEDVTPPPARGAEPDAAIALFDMNATPEAEQQGRFVRRLAQTLPPAVPLLILVDEAAFDARFATMHDRTAQRRAAWAALARTFGTAAVFVDLASPDLSVADRMMQAALDRPVERPPAATA